MSQIVGKFEKGDRGIICRSPSDFGAWVAPDRRTVAMADIPYLLEITGTAASGRLRFARVIATVEVVRATFEAECQRIYNQAVAEAAVVDESVWQRAEVAVETLCQMKGKIETAIQERWEASPRKQVVRQERGREDSEGYFELYDVVGWDTKPESAATAEEKEELQKISSLLCELSPRRIPVGKVRLEINGHRNGVWDFNLHAEAGGGGYYGESTPKHLFEMTRFYLKREVDGILALQEKVAQVEEFLST